MLIVVERSYPPEREGIKATSSESLRGVSRPCGGVLELTRIMMSLLPPSNSRIILDKWGLLLPSSTRSWCSVVLLGNSTSSASTPAFSESHNKYLTRIFIFHQLFSLLRVI